MSTSCSEVYCKQVRRALQWQQTAANNCDINIIKVIKGIITVIKLPQHTFALMLYVGNLVAAQRIGV
jgi:hypothetical protein